MSFSKSVLLSISKVASNAKQSLERRLYGDAFWKLFTRLDLFVPFVRGPRSEVVKITFLAAEQSFPLMAHLSDMAGKKGPEILKAERFCTNKTERDAAMALKTHLDRFGSDKATRHNYHLVYGAIFSRLQPIRTVFEVGLGTNNEDVISNMSPTGKPGASLRAFREYLGGESKLYGADIDKRILFSEERIMTFFVDQTDLATFERLDLPDGLDLIIDDGLHAPNANLATLIYAMRKIRVGGWIVIEDIPPKALPVWRVAGALLEGNFTTTVVEADHTVMFVAQRRA